MAPQKRQGWFIVGGLFVAMLLVFGAGYDTTPTFLPALLKPGAAVFVIDWNAGVERPVGPPRDHVYTAAEARERMEWMGLPIESERMFKYHYALVARSA